ncbi:HAD family hydrolase [Haloferax sp. S1W]|uniref:HAD family hydrolase n=1 Tax=Haloferax sp. S1W TaxID=3377110 RepID=UPI0037CADE59
MTRYDAVLFDSDGILVEPPSYETQREATRQAFHAVGVEDVRQKHLDAAVGGGTVETLHEVCSEYDLDVTEFWDAFEHHDEQSQFDAFEAGERTLYDDVNAVSDLPVTRGVVSNNHHSTIEFKLDFFGLHSLFDTYYGREKTIESLRLMKPNTHYIDRAMADLGAESALYVGDSDSDMVAAERAGLDSAFVRRSHCQDADLSVTPTYDVDSLHDIVPLVV